MDVLLGLFDAVSFVVSLLSLTAGTLLPPQVEISWQAVATEEKGFAAADVKFASEGKPPGRYFCGLQALVFPPM